MNKFEKQLEKWNNGLLRGAQAKLAKCLQVSTATVALWATGKRHPSKGFITQMAKLFNLDEYSVVRLFTNVPTYRPTDFLNTETAYSLHDAAPSALHYEATPYPQKNEKDIVKLPVFTKQPEKYPLYKTTDIQSWWQVPADFATQTDFLFLLPSKTDTQRILFVRLRKTWEKNFYMLGKKGARYILVRTRRKNSQLVLETEEGTLLPSTTIKPIGLVVKQVVNLN